jgi:hypothetical protein
MKWVWLMWLLATITMDLWAEQEHQLTLTRWIIEYIPEFVMMGFLLWVAFHLAVRYRR